MNCVIITFVNVYNFGAFLQAYSLKEYIEQHGDEVCFTATDNNRVLEPYRLNPFHRPVGVRLMINRIKSFKLGKIRQAMAFERSFKFLGETIKGDKDTVNSLSPDIVIVGSDQVWNDSLTGETDYYYLPWLDKHIKRMSFAASLGKKTLSNYQKKCIREYINDFDYISLREPIGIKEIRDLTSRNAEVVLDPVFLNDAVFWMNAARESRINMESGNYILFYSLSGSSELKNEALELASNTGMKVIAIHPTGVKQHKRFHQLYDVGPFEFLHLVKSANLVVTDSFHCTAFSLLFEKKYCNTRSNIDSRIGSLLNRISAYQSCETECCGQKILDFSYLDHQLLNNLIHESKAFLNKAL